MCEASWGARVQAQWRYRSVEISKRVEMLNWSSRISVAHIIILIG